MGCSGRGRAQGGRGEQAQPGRRTPWLSRAGRARSPPRAGFAPLYGVNRRGGSWVRLGKAQTGAPRPLPCPRSSASPTCSTPSAPSLGTGSPICSKGAWRPRNARPTRRPDARDCGGGGGPLPTRHPLGRPLISQQQDWGTSGSQWPLCPFPAPGLPPPRGLRAGWERGAPRRPLGPGGGSETPAPGPSPILYASKFLSNTFWGSPQPPPDLSWQVWVPLSLPWEGLQ